MAQKPLDPHGGSAVIVGTKLVPADADRLDQLAERRGKTRSATVRELIWQAIREEQDTGPPGPQAA
jgi:hypothetical protein